MAKQLRNTAQRALVLDAVRTSRDHPTAEKIFLRVSEKAPQISLGTVYRNLSLLSELGEILRISSPYGPDHFDFNLENHYHFFCSECHEVYDVPSDLVPHKKDLMQPRNCGFEIADFSLSYYGVCPHCKKEMEAG